jgi:hypothetical protein
MDEKHPISTATALIESLEAILFEIGRMEEAVAASAGSWKLGTPFSPVAGSSAEAAVRLKGGATHVHGSPRCSVLSCDCEEKHEPLEIATLKGVSGFGERVTIEQDDGFVLEALNQTCARGGGESARHDDKQVLTLMPPARCSDEPRDDIKVEFSVPCDDMDAVDDVGIQRRRQWSVNGANGGKVCACETLQVPQVTR